MPRSGRRLSDSKAYHVMIRGNERKALFLDDDDRSWFVGNLALKNQEHKFSIYAYCLMDNHVHLVINEGGEQISRIMKRLQVSYAYYFNKKYNRIGHLFQDRFKSEVIEDDQYLLAAVRYVHRNPVKAGITQQPSEYRWSSYNHYFNNRSGSPKDLVEVGPILLMFSKNPDQAVQLFKKFSLQEGEEPFIEHQEKYESQKEIQTTSEVQSFIADALNKRQLRLEELSNVKNKLVRNELIQELKHRSNLSIREIAEVLGVNRNVVQRQK